MQICDVDVILFLCNIAKSMLFQNAFKIKCGKTLHV